MYRVAVFVDCRPSRFIAFFLLPFFSTKVDSFQIKLKIPFQFVLLGSTRV
jgi:hypothetical protein